MTESRRGIQLVGRRVFLRGAASAVVALPLLEGFLPKRARAEDTAQPFAVFVRQGNGCQQASGSEPDRFWPTNLGALNTAGMKADAGKAVSTLADHAAKLLLVRGVEMKALEDAGCGHSQGGLLCLTASRADGKNIQNALSEGESLDNRIARELMGPGKEPLTLRAGMRSSYLDDVLSYRSAGNRRVAESNPYNAYKALFGLATSSTGSADPSARRKSVNDLVRGEMAALLANPKLSASDRDRVQQHQQAIRDLETGMQCSLPPAMLDPLSLTTTVQAESDAAIVQTVKYQCQVIALAVACGKTRAATLQIGNGNDQTQYTINGTKYERYHFISHRVMSDGATGDAIDNADVKHHDIDVLFASMFKGLLDELSARKTASGGTLLDEGVAIWLNDLSTGPPHGLQNVPYVCAGSCNGALKTGTYVDAGNKAKNQFVSHNKFLNTIGAAVGCKNAAGAPLDDFGDPSLAKGSIPQMGKV